MHTQGALKWTIFLGATALVVYSCLLILNPFVTIDELLRQMLLEYGVASRETRHN